MDLKRTAKEHEGCFVDVVLVDGVTRRGTVQAPPASVLDDVLPLLDESKSGTLPAGGQTAVSLQEYLDLVELIPLSRVRSIEKIETAIGGLVVTTEQGKPINQDGMALQIQNVGRPGYVGVMYKMPGSDAWSPQHVVRITKGEVSLPVTMTFISYARENRSAIEPVIGYLRRHDIFVWEDEGLLLPGDHWESKIEHAISCADYFLLFISAETMERDGYKNRELRLALKKQSMKALGKRFIIPVLVDACEPPDDLREFHWLRMWEPGWDTKLLRAIGPLHIRQARANAG